MTRYILTTGGNIDINLSDEQEAWFGDRMTESSTGRILVPARLYTEFKKITGVYCVTNQQIKDFLIDNCY